MKEQCLDGTPAEGLQEKTKCRLMVKRRYLATIENLHIIACMAHGSCFARRISRIKLCTASIHTASSSNSVSSSLLQCLATEKACAQTQLIHVCLGRPLLLLADHFLTSLVPSLKVMSLTGLLWAVRLIRPKYFNCLVNRVSERSVAPVRCSISLFGTRDRKEGRTLHILRKHCAWKLSRRLRSACRSHRDSRPYINFATAQAS